MADLEHDQTHEGAGLLKLAPPFWGKPRIASILYAYLREVQALEDALWSYIAGLDVDTCGRWVLEGLAKIVGESRRPTSIDTLRTLVRGRVAVNASDGTPGAIARVISTLTAGTVQVLEIGEEIRVMQLDTLDPDDPDAAADLLDEACDGGAPSCWLTGCGTGSVRFPSYGDTSGADDAVCFGTGTWSNHHG